MKSKLFAALLLIVSSANAQKIEKYYNYLWKETTPDAARFFALIQKTDTGWHRMDYFIHEKILQMEGNYKDSACNIPVGKFHYFHSNGMLEETGNYTDGTRDSLWLKFYPDGMMEDSAYYINGHRSGTSMSWYQNGFPSDSSVFNNDGSGMEIKWFDTGTPASAGVYAAGRKTTGRWQYFHSNGKLSSLEIYKDGEMINKQYFDEGGNAMTDTASNDREATFPGGQKAWSKYVYKGVYFPEQYKIVNSDSAVVVVRFIIDTDGNVKDSFVSTPFYPQFDKMALAVIKKSPKWIPARNHNRNMYGYRLQPINFQQ